MTGMLSEVVSVSRRFRRSVRIGADADVSEIEGFVCTATAAQAIETTIEHVSRLGHTAFTWTGPYGCGKSTLALMLATVLGRAGPERDKVLQALPIRLQARLPEAMRWTKPGWKVIPVVGRRGDPCEVIGAAVTRKSINEEPIAALLKLAKSEPCGVLLVIDEMGKLLEHSATGDGDAYFFQELAEAAARSDGRLVVVGVLHQAFDDYAHRLARETRDEWLKVQGRFVDVPLSPTSEEQVELLSRAIKSSPPKENAAVSVVASALARGADRAIVAKRLQGCWPLNPVVASLLGPLSRRRFGQNQRSIFGFLGSAEPFGFQDFLLSTSQSSKEQYSPPWLWSYLRTNLEPSILASPDGHRWAIAVDAIERVEDRGADELDVAVLKTVALLDLFRERSGLAATAELIAAGLTCELALVEQALQHLVQRSALVFRRHLDAFAIFAGSDFDIEEAVQSARSEMVSCDYRRLRATGVLTPILAKREYHETGAMRWFDVDVTSLDRAEERICSFQADQGASGLFLLLVNEANEQGSGLRKRLTALTELIGQRPIAFAVSSDSHTLREMSYELVALERVNATRPELKGDAVARREITSRLARLAGDLEDRLRSGLANTYWRVPALTGEELSVSGAASLSVIASRMAAALYPQSPRIRNELLNRSKPSANAMAALRSVMTAMALRSAEPRLGIEGFPAEGGLYASVLEATKLHTRRYDGSYGFAVPQDDEHRLEGLWKAADELLTIKGSEGLILSDVFAVWRERPFGVKDGLLSIFGLAYLLSRREQLSVYLDSTFCSSVGDLLVDRLLQDASSVRLRLSNLSKRDAAILAGVADLVAETTGSATNVDPLSVGRELVAMVMATPAWVRRTSRLSSGARRVRDLALSAHDPNKFVFDDLPRIVGESADTEAVIAELRQGLEELGGAYAAMLSSLRDLLLTELRAKSDSALEAVRQRAKGVMGITGNYRLDAFAARLSTFDDTKEAIEGIASLAANRPPRDWVDRDVDAARVELASLCREFLRAEGLAHVQGRGDHQFSFALYLSDPEKGGLITPEISVDREDLESARKLAASLRAVVGTKVSREVAIAAALELAAAFSGESASSEAPLAAMGGSR
jgi:hypothetical protein